MRNLYRHADSALKRLYAFAATLFQQSSMLASWDELNVIRNAQDIFVQMDEAARREFLWIARKARKDVEAEMALPHKEMDDDFIFMLFARYDPKTQYQYRNEWTRKRDRLVESAIAVQQANQNYRGANSNELRAVLQRAMNLMERQLREMADTVTDETRNEAFAEAGIEKVMWNTQKDERVCSVCRERDGKVYPLFGVPPKHRRCRCYLTPVVEEENPQ